LRVGAAPKETLIREIPAHDSFVLTVALSPDERMVGTTSWDEPVKLWDGATWEPLGDFRGTPPAGQSHCPALHPTLSHILVSSPNGEVRIHTLDLGELIAIAIAEAGPSRDMTNKECIQYLGEPCLTP
jgi:WD40 repeat protein